MKLWDNYKKELKIASRGFYFYMEIITAVILLAALILLFVPAETTNVTREVVFMDGPRDVLDTMIAESFGEPGQYQRAEDTSVRLRPAEITYFDEQTGEAFEKSFTDKKTLALETWEYV